MRRDVARSLVLPARSEVIESLHRDARVGLQAAPPADRVPTRAACLVATWAAPDDVFGYQTPGLISRNRVRMSFRDGSARDASSRIAMAISLRPEAR
jgi:hypothetical protein